MLTVNLKRRLLEIAKKGQKEKVMERKIFQLNKQNQCGLKYLKEGKITSNNLYASRSNIAQYSNFHCLSKLAINSLLSSPWYFNKKGKLSGYSSQEKMSLVQI